MSSLVPQPVGKNNTMSLDYIVVKVKSGGKMADMVARRGDDPRVLAQNFLIKNNFNMKGLDKLAAHVAAKINEYLINDSDLQERRNSENFIGKSEESTYNRMNEMHLSPPKVATAASSADGIGMMMINANSKSSHMGGVTSNPHSSSQLHEDDNDSVCENEFSSLEPSRIKAIRKCSVHNSETVQFCCETCDPNVLCCQSCVVNSGHKEKGHVLSTVDNVSRKKEQIIKACSQSEDLLKGQKDILVTVDNHLLVHQGNCDSSRRHIANLRSAVIESVEKLTAAWLDELESHGASTIKLLSAEKKAIQTQIRNGESSIMRAKGMLERLHDVEIFEQCDRLLEEISDANKKLSAPSTLTDVPASNVSKSVASDFNSSVSKLFDANPFKLPSNRRLTTSTFTLCGRGSGNGSGAIAADSSKV